MSDVALAEAASPRDYQKYGPDPTYDGAAFRFSHPAAYGARKQWRGDHPDIARRQDQKVKRGESKDKVREWGKQAVARDKAAKARGSRDPKPEGRTASASSFRGRGGTDNSKRRNRRGEFTYKNGRKVPLEEHALVEGVRTADDAVALAAWAHHRVVLCEGLLDTIAKGPAGPRRRANETALQLVDAEPGKVRDALEEELSFARVLAEAMPAPAGRGGKKVNKPGSKKPKQVEDERFEEKHPRDRAGLFAKKGQGMGEEEPQENVRKAQKALRSAGRDPGPIDGRFGNRTAAAVRTFQKAAGIEQSGDVDDATARALKVRTGDGKPGDAKADFERRTAAAQKEIEKDEAEAAAKEAAKGAGGSSRARAGSSRASAGTGARGAKADPGNPKAVDPASPESIEAFQRAHGLKVDGVIGPDTQSAMRREREREKQRRSAERASGRGEGAAGGKDDAPDPKGDDLKELQRHLRSLGYDLGDGGVDGKLGPKTRAAIKKFQKDNDLPATGKMDKTTRKRLNTRGSTKRAEAKTGGPDPQRGAKAREKTRNRQRDEASELEEARIALREAVGGFEHARALARLRLLQEAAALTEAGFSHLSTAERRLLARRRRRSRTGEFADEGKVPKGESAEEWRARAKTTLARDRVRNEALLKGLPEPPASPPTGGSDTSEARRMAAAGWFPTGVPFFDKRSNRWQVTVASPSGAMLEHRKFHREDQARAFENAFRGNRQASDLTAPPATGGAKQRQVDGMATSMARSASKAAAAEKERKSRERVADAAQSILTNRNAPRKLPTSPATGGARSPLQFSDGDVQEMARDILRTKLDHEWLERFSGLTTENDIAALSDRQLVKLDRAIEREDFRDEQLSQRIANAIQYGTHRDRLGAIRAGIPIRPRRGL